MLGRIGDESLRAYVVWVPILPDDNYTAALESRALVPDDRATHFWDEAKVLPSLFAPVLELPHPWPAWDVYLAYGPGTRWDPAAPPTPTFWQHQLGELPAAPRFSGTMFAARLRTILAGTAS